jgi:hypothetical protein
MVFVINNINPTIEIYRAILLNEFRTIIFNVIKKSQPEITNINIYKYFTNWLLFQYMFEQKDDPIIPTNFKFDVIYDGLDLHYYNNNTYLLLLNLPYYEISNNLLNKLIDFNNLYGNIKYNIVCKKKNNYMFFKYISNTTIKEFTNNYFITTSIKIPLSQYNIMIKKFKNISYANIIIFNILMRYLAIASLGNQIAIHPNILYNFKKKLNLQIEGFASSINHYFNKYYSLFPDLEHHFGSLGRFFQSDFIDGVYSLNPPFYMLTFNYIANKILYELNNTNKKLLFLLWFPVLDIDGANFVKHNCIHYNKRPIKMVLKKNKTSQIDVIKNSKFNIITKIFCDNDLSYFDYNTICSVPITYTYLFVLGSHTLDFSKIRNIINNTTYVYK